MGMGERVESSGRNIEEEDRMSGLPEDLVIRILMLIPTKDAVATEILSKRWRFMWRMVPRLEYKEDNDDDDYYGGDSEDDDDDDDESKKKSVWWFLNKSMEHHKAGWLESLCIKLGRQCPSDADIEKWVANAVDRGVRMLRLKLGWSGDPTRLPKSLYTCQTLKELTLSHKIIVDFPSSCLLPKLTLLQLFNVVYEDETCLVRLLSSCPVLEILCVERKKDDNLTEFSVKGACLGSLCYNDYYDDDSDAGRCLAMDTPALKNLYIIDYSGNSCSVEKNMPCLEDAYINIKYFPGIDKFSRTLSSVLSLELRLTDDDMILCGAIKFSRLTKLKISPSDSDWMDSLLLLLQNTPKLNSFTVDYGSTDQPPNASASWSRSISVPECLSSTLEKFELIDYGGREEEEELVEYILATSECLKTATISMSSNKIKLEDRETKMEELKAMYRDSITSQLYVKT